MRLLPIPGYTSSVKPKGIGYTIRLPANRVLQDRIGYIYSSVQSDLDRPVASTTRAGMRSQGDQMREPRGETHAAIQAKRRVSALRCRQLSASITSCPRRSQFAAVRAGQGDDSDLRTARNLANVG